MFQHHHSVKLLCTYHFLPSFICFTLNIVKLGNIERAWGQISDKGEKTASTCTGRKPKCISCPACLPTPLRLWCIFLWKQLPPWAAFALFTCSFVRHGHQDYSVSKSMGTEKGHMANCGPAIIFFSRCTVPKHLSARRARCCKKEKQTFLVWERIQSHMRMKIYTTLSLPFFIYF